MGLCLKGCFSHGFTLPCRLCQVAGWMGPWRKQVIPLFRVKTERVVLKEQCFWIQLLYLFTVTNGCAAHSQPKKKKSRADCGNSGQDSTYFSLLQGGEFYSLFWKQSESVLHAALESKGLFPLISLPVADSLYVFPSCPGDGLNLW